MYINKFQERIAMNSNGLPIIFAEGAKKKDTFFHRSLFHLNASPQFLHYHDVLELGVCLSGSGTFITPNFQKSFKAGDVQVIPPFYAHYNVASEEGSLWTFIDIDVPRISSPHVTTDPAFLIKLAHAVKVSGIFCEKDSPLIVSLVRSIASLLQTERSSEPPILDLAVAKLVTLLLELSVMVGDGDDVIERTRKADVILPAIAVATASIEKGQKISPSDMASACFMSESYFRKIFTSIMGEPPKVYLCRMQVQKAAALLVTTKLSVHEIALKCCFEDSSAFYRQFMKTYGISPASYRARAKNTSCVFSYRTTPSSEQE